LKKRVGQEDSLPGKMRRTAGGEGGPKFRNWPKDNIRGAKDQGTRLIEVAQRKRGQKKTTEEEEREKKKRTKEEKGWPARVEKVWPCPEKRKRKPGEKGGTFERLNTKKRKKSGGGQKKSSLTPFLKGGLLENEDGTEQVPRKGERAS